MSVDDERALAAWAERWHLTDRWCTLLAHDTLRWWVAHPEVRGWEFERTGIFAGFFPFKLEPLKLGPFYHDPTWRRRRDFKKDVLQQVNQALDVYCNRIEAAALAAGLKRSPRRLGRRPLRPADTLPDQERTLRIDRATFLVQIQWRPADHPQSSRRASEIHRTHLTVVNFRKDSLKLTLD